MIFLELWVVKDVGLITLVLGYFTSLKTDEFYGVKCKIRVDARIIVVE